MQRIKEIKKQLLINDLNDLYNWAMMACDDCSDTPYTDAKKIKKEYENILKALEKED